MAKGDRDVRFSGKRVLVLTFSEDLFLRCAAIIELWEVVIKIIDVASMGLIVGVGVVAV